MKDQAKELVTSISGPRPRRLSRIAWVGAVATVAAGSLLFTASASVPAAQAPDHDLDVPVQLYGLVESAPAGQTETVPDDVRLGHVVTVPERTDQRQGPSVQESLATVEVRGAQERQGFSLRATLLDVVGMFGGSTLGHANGRIPAAALCPLEFAPGHLLRCDAAERLAALSEEFEREFGYPIPITDSYRSYVQQIAVARAKPHLAAVPGTSNHGWGLAVDLSDPIAGGASQEYVWLRLHGPDYGWDNPSWARLGGAKPEPWHFEFFAAGAVPHRATDPADVGTWVSADSGGSDGVSPRYKPDLDPKPRDGSTADGVRKPSTEPADGPSTSPPSRRPSEPTPKPVASEPTSKPTTPTTSPAPSPRPSPSQPGQEPPASPSPPPTPVEPSPSPTPTPSGPGEEPTASPSPSPTPSEPAPSPTPTPTPSGDDETPPAPMPSPSPSVPSGALSGLAKGLGLAVDDVEED